MNVNRAHITYLPHLSVSNVNVGLAYEMDSCELGQLNTIYLKPIYITGPPWNGLLTIIQVRVEG